MVMSCSSRGQTAFKPYTENPGDVRKTDSTCMLLTETT